MGRTELVIFHVTFARFGNTYFVEILTTSSKRVLWLTPSW